MKNSKKICALLLAGVMALGMGTVSFAEGETDGSSKVPTIGEGTKDQPITEVPFTKKLELAEGIEMQDMTFTFAVTPITENAPTATIRSIEYKSTDAKGELTDGKYSIEKEGEITFGTLSKVGTYEYRVTETEGTDENVTYSGKSYLMKVYVANGANVGDFYIQSVTAEEEGVKQEIIEFTNIYTKDASLSITKKVEGDFAERDKDFEFKITMFKSGTATGNTFEGKIGDKAVTCESGVETVFKLHHGQALVFENIPAGTRYKVEELAATDGYTPSVVVTENGTEHEAMSAASEDQGITTEATGQGSCLVGENTNSVEFTNTFNKVALTGVIMKNLPFILLIGIGICALGVLAISKKRRMANR